MYRNFEDLIKKRLDLNGSPKKLILAGAEDAHALEAVFMAQAKGYISPVLVGDKDKIVKIIENIGAEEQHFDIFHCAEKDNPGEIAVKLIKENQGDFIMKGRLDTKSLLKPILQRDKGLNKNGFITHFGLMELKNYHKLLAMSDCAVIPYPSFKDKVRILEIVFEALKKLGYSKPVAGALCAAEAISDKMPETIEANKLQELSNEGYFKDGIVVGPISLDLALSKESAMVKGYESPYAGDVDMLLVPQMVTGNVMSKIWNSDSENILAGCVLGADVPIVLTSRSASTDEKLHSIILCALLC
ncbi:phosphate acyltransferase [Alloiococcus sp. CFN-8]|uniref:phosphate acyltransferase n=1 Tax=Alloiococcus sp. CFN-8 TaxID=3416081 RepID=UPI003CEE2F1F